MRTTITAEDIAAIPSGTVCPLEPGAVVTPLAADLAREKNIRFEFPKEGRQQPILALGADHGGFAAKEAFWLQTGEGEPRHGRRVQKIRDIELQYLRRRI
jgi:hypothetical protein